VTELLNDVEVT